ncbi:MAG: class I SAM-dependent methyltransferase [Magnetococcales bacterium]|nr:class I SAM-dependent methyltransferase [Magnetococcales bacterium]
MRDYVHYDRFLDRLSLDVYPELPGAIADMVTGQVMGDLVRGGILVPGLRILDIGCGQGVALERFRDHGLTAEGITLGTDYEVCLNKGLRVHQMDQNFMTFADGAFDFLWCRHVLEHSVAPFFTLSEYLRITRPGGRIYVEVPAPDTSAHHERNPNHYSVLPDCLWQALFARAGLTLEGRVVLNFELACGPDEYWAYLLRR